MPSLRSALLASLLFGAPAAAAQADLNVEKRTESEEVEIGAEAVFFIAVTNHGPRPATGVEVEDALPGGLVYAGAAASRGTFDASSGVWRVDSLAVGRTEVLTLRTTFTAPDPVENCVAVRASDQQGGEAANEVACAYVRPKRERLDPFAAR